MKNIFSVISIIAVLGALLGLFGCSGGFGSDSDKVTYCAESGCPSEAAYESIYCYRHECCNLNCHNKRAWSDADYCEECLARAVQ